jgi:hypothetical protein
MSYLEDFKKGLFCVGNTDIDKIKVVLKECGVKNPKGNHSFYFCKEGKVFAGRNSPHGMAIISITILYNECTNMIKFKTATPKKKEEKSSFYSHAFPITMNLMEAHEFMKEFYKIEKGKAQNFADKHYLTLITGTLIITEEEYLTMKKYLHDGLQDFFDKTFSKYLTLKHGTPCLVSAISTGGNWVLRYANGNGKFYDNTKKSKKSSQWPHFIPLTPETLKDLPCNE